MTRQREGSASLSMLAAAFRPSFSPLFQEQLNNRGLVTLSTNTFKAGPQYGIFASTQILGTSVWISSNTILPKLTSTRITYGIYLNGLRSGATVQNNDIFYRSLAAGATSYGFWVRSSTGIYTHHNRISNPGMITTGGSFIGAHLEGASYSSFMFNDVHSSGTSFTQAYLMEIVSGSTVVVRNNVFLSSVTPSAKGSTATISLSQNSGFPSNYNSFYSSNSLNSCSWGTKTAQFSAGWFGKDANSITGNPLWPDTRGALEDFHPKSTVGRYRPATDNFLPDPPPSAGTIDTADPAESYVLEISPDGLRANMGSYGNTDQASKGGGVSPASSVTVSNVAGTTVTVAGQVAVLKVIVANAHELGDNPVEMSQLVLHFTNGAGSPADLALSTAIGLFQNIFIYRDNPALGTLGKFQSSFDIAVATVTNAQLTSVFGAGGLLTINNANGTLANPDVELNLQTEPTLKTTYYIVTELAVSASTQNPNTFDIRVDADGSTGGQGSIEIRDGATNIAKSLNATSLVNSSQLLAVSSAAAPVGYTKPDISTAIYSIPIVGDDGKIYVTGGDGVIYRFAASGGAEEWSFASGAAIQSSPWTCCTSAGGANPYDEIYFGNDAGNVYRIHSGSGTATWTKALGATTVRASPGFDGSHVYIGASNNNFYKLRNQDGTGEVGYSTPTLGGVVSSIPSKYSGTSYVGSQAAAGNTFYAINTANGTPTGNISVGRIAASPFIDDLTGNIFFGSQNGTFYGRNGATLGAITNWTDYVIAGSTQINSSPFIVNSGVNQYAYFGADNGVLYKLNTNCAGACGNLIWQYPAVGGGNFGAITSGPVPNSTLNPTFMVFGSDDGGIYVIRNLDSTPTLEPGFPVFTGAEITGSPSIDTSVTPNQVFINSRDGKVYRYDITP